MEDAWQWHFCEIISGAHYRRPADSAGKSVTQFGLVTSRVENKRQDAKEHVWRSFNSCRRLYNHSFLRRPSHNRSLPILSKQSSINQHRAKRATKLRPWNWGKPRKREQLGQLFLQRLKAGLPELWNQAERQEEKQRLTVSLTQQLQNLVVWHPWRAVFVVFIRHTQGRFQHQHTAIITEVHLHRSDAWQKKL